MRSIHLAIARLRSWNRERVRRRRAARANREVFSVLTCVKNEALHISEWIDHYFWQGAAHLVIIDNGSTDDTVRRIETHPRRRDITLFQWSRPFHQIGHCRRAIRETRLRERFHWLIVADGDEFWFSPSGEPLARVLPQFQRIDLIYCNWTLFGNAPSGEHPATLRDTLVRCQPDPGAHDFTKWAVRTDALRNLDMLEIHKVGGIDSRKTVSDGHKLQINHYFTQSRSYWRDVKMQRGSAVDPATSKLRTWEMFDTFEAACTATDDRLARLVRAERARGQTGAGEHRATAAS